MNIDHQLAENWIKQNSKVLDLGCGDGTLLAHLQTHLGVTGYGLEIDEHKINQAIAKGLNIIEQDLNEGLHRFADNSFDTVVMARALQAVKNPKNLLLDMLRVANEGIVTFPNFAYWQNRVYLGIKGIMPMSETIPHEWYDTPNIHLCTFKDFERLCADNDIRILDAVAINDDSHLPARLMNKIVRAAPNLLADVAIYRIAKG
ncbi:methionine biosynthesis protein MetW [Moraxella caviae]|uniref:Methionine biosynthesis protein MetW n=1 Tax=Moraxella caviae TaxID=34060 RepID=A0A1T0ACH0_9GAMM|nr:methionine biosynthesis protein MetW [Moraxella caviae]OOR93425.1 methionine biosynthesis protein MetW [Moraxella caviae]STZ14083.1 methionine biosynthesis protein MetW [Moraxella caviae]VEW11154.1 methionine biosynthesis protein MetW [Moraxella caviae]